MTIDIPESHLARVSTYIAAAMGLHFPKERFRDLERGIKAAARELGIADGKSCIEWLLSSTPTRSQIEILAGHLTVSETYFFRDKKLFKALDQLILPELIPLRRKSGKHLRIWSAGCSSGEEPYSLAILLSSMIPDIAEWNIHILATDINTQSLQKAVAGVYRHWSFRDNPPWIKDGYFSQKKDGSFELLPRVRKMVTFSYLNLAEDSYPLLFNNTTALDIIFCRNVLMYFVPELAGKVAQKLHRCLVDGGILTVSPSELSNPAFSRFKTVRAPGAIFYRKEGSNRSAPFPCAPLEKPKPVKPALKSVPAAAPVRKPAGARLAPRPEAPGGPVESPAVKADDPNRKELYREASALYEEGCYPEAVEKAEELLSQHLPDPNVLILLARIHANMGKLDKALEWCEKAIVAEKLHAGHRYLLATILQELGRAEEAVASFKKTLYLDPKFVTAYVALGNISRKSGRHKESVKHLKNALALLDAEKAEDVLPGEGSINAGRLIEIIRTMLRIEPGS